MRRRAPKIFTGTNVWFSAFYGSANSEKLLKAHVRGQIKAVISRQVLDELVRNVRAKIPTVEMPLKKFLEASPPEIIRDAGVIPRKLATLVHLKDAPLVAAAIQARLPLFVTGNRRDFRVDTLKKKYHLSVLTPKQIVDLLKI